MRICAFILSFLLVASLSFGADIDGTYSGEVETQMGFGFGGGRMGGGMGQGGPRIFTFNFKAEGTTLNGTFQGAAGPPVEIRDGIIKGNKVWFLVDRDLGQQKSVLSFKGKFRGKKIKLEFKTITEDSQWIGRASKVTVERVN